MEFNWLDHIFVLFLMVIFPALSMKSGKMSDETPVELPPKIHLFYTNGLMLIIGALLILTSWNLTGRSWSALGIQLPTYHIYNVYAVLGISLLYLSNILYVILNKKYKTNKINELSGVIPLTWQEYRHYIFLAVAAGISEEIIFRGFLINYLQHYLSGYAYASILAIVLPALVFSLSHLYQGWWSVLKIFFVALMFGWIFVQSGSLLIVIIVHISIDLISGIVGIGGNGKEEI